MLHLLIAELKLLDQAGELADRRFEPVDAHDELGRIGRSTRRLTRNLTWNLSRRQRRLLAAREQLREQVGIALLRGGGRGRKTENEDGKADAGGCKHGNQSME